MEWTTLLKLVHVIAAIVAVGANLTYTYWIRYAERDRDRLAWAIAGVRRLDDRIATPAYVLLLITGISPEQPVRPDHVGVRAHHRHPHGRQADHLVRGNA
jgi:hypothetical protein